MRTAIVVSLILAAFVPMGGAAWLWLSPAPGPPAAGRADTSPAQQVSVEPRPPSTAPSPIVVAPAMTAPGGEAPVPNAVAATSPSPAQTVSRPAQSEEAITRETIEGALREVFTNNPAFRHRLLEAAEAQAAKETPSNPEEVAEQAKAAREAMAPILGQMLQSPAFTDQVRRLTPPPTQEGNRP